MILDDRAEKIAQDILETANVLSNQISVIDDMGKENWQAVREESDAYETVVLQGIEVLRALRTIAMRLDRAALVKSQNEDD